MRRQDLSGLRLLVRSRATAPSSSSAALMPAWLPDIPCSHGPATPFAPSGSLTRSPRARAASISGRYTIKPTSASPFRRGSPAPVQRPPRRFGSRSAQLKRRHLRIPPDRQFLGHRSFDQHLSSRTRQAESSVLVHGLG